MKAHERLFDAAPLLYLPRRSVRHRGPLPTPRLLDTCPCPRCRAPLVARMGCLGPYFHCGCPPVHVEKA
jgi:hypothetical protein